MKSTEGRTRRRHRRFIKRLKTEFSSDSESFTGMLSNLSENGLFIRTRKSFIPGTIIDVELLMPDNKKSFLKGLVIWVRKTPISAFKNGMGIELIKKDGTYINLLRSLDEESKIPIENNSITENMVYKTRDHIEEKVAIESELSIADAELYISQNRYADAMDTYNKLSSMYPNNTFVLQRIEELKSLMKLITKEI